MTIDRLSVGLLLALIGSLFLSVCLKDQHLWMDEVLGYLLISDPSLAHANEAIVSGMDANPPLFVNLYWALGHGISLNPLFLKGVSITLFALTVAWFYRYITAGRLLGVSSQDAGPINLVLILVALSLTYLNFTLSTQIRSYSLYLLLGWAYVVILHQLLHQRRQGAWLLAHGLVGTAFLFTHNVALFYIASSGAFFGLLWLFTKERRYLSVLGGHVLMGVIWLVAWYPSFAIQTQAGKPHSWIPMPTFLTAFRTIGDLLPTLSSGLEKHLPVLTVLRVLVVMGLFVYIALPRLRKEGSASLADKGFSLYLLSGFLTGFTLLLGLVVSLVHTSVFLNRYFWPSSLLLLYQLLYAGWVLIGERRYASVTKRSSVQIPTAIQTATMVLFMVCVGAFIVCQAIKVPLFSGAIRRDIAALKPGQPVMVESAYYFLPMWFHQIKQPIYYLLHWPTALDSRNVLESTTDYKILEGVATHYQPKGLLTTNQFNKNTLSRFYVVDEASRYQIEGFVASGKVKVHQIIPTSVAGHRILDCSLLDSQ